MQAETFLRNRNWIVGSSTNLREALAYIIQKNPQYVLITSDHPNKKVRVLPKMLMQAFPVRVIGFAEKGTSNSTKNLHDMALEYNLYPPVSGPAIERMILKIRKDDETKLQNENLVKSGKSGETLNAGNELITFKGETAGADALKASFDQARAALSQLVNSDGGGSESEGAAHIPGSDASGANSFQQSGPHGQDSFNPAYRGSAMGGVGGMGPSSGRIEGTGDGFGAGSADSKANMAGQGRADSDDAGFGYGSPAGGFGKSSPGPSQGKQDSAFGENSRRPGRRSMQNSNAGENEDSDALSKTDAKTAAARARAGQSGQNDGHPQGMDGDPAADPSSGATSPIGSKRDSKSAPDAENSESGTSSGGSSRSRKNSAPIMESEYVPKAAAKPYRMRQEKEPKNPDEKTSIFVQGAYQSLKETANLKGQDTAEEISQSSNVACIQVESPRFSGYLVCAMGRDRKIDKTFIDIIKQRLLRFLKESGEEMRDKDTLNLKIQAVNFTTWALEQAEFLKKSVHDGDEIAIAFFPTKIQDPDLQSSVSEKMVMIHMNELKDDAPVEFDMYIFMPENNKYLLYTPQGRPFYGKQKDRLKDKGITHMHLRKEAAPNVQKYRAQNFLNDKISAYRSGKKPGS